MQIIRVFPRRTSMTPTDSLAFVGEPPLPGFRPENADMVFISVCFTWDMDRAWELRTAWRDAYAKATVLIGGPAYDKPELMADRDWKLLPDFTAGRFVREGITFTTRGCNNNCPWCLVPKREGRLRELNPVVPGYIIQDNNFLQASPSHRHSVYAMLADQPRAAIFSGGLDATLVTDEVAEELRGLRIESVFLAADTNGSLGALRRAIKKLSFLPRRKLRVYALAAFNGETPRMAEARMECIWEAGGLPFCQLYQPPGVEIRYPPEWRALQRTWGRPAAMFALHKESG